MTSDVDVDFDPADSTLTLSSPTLHLSIRVHPTMLARLDGVATANWDDGGAIAAGRCLGGNVYWCAGELPGTVNLLIGPDDQSWEIALVLPDDVVGKVLAIAQR